jgi:hypothetical protein
MHPESKKAPLSGKLTGTLGSLSVQNISTPGRLLQYGSEGEPGNPDGFFEVTGTSTRPWQQESFRCMSCQSISEIASKTIYSTILMNHQLGV